ncbi:hypothetical protein [Clostridium autoethanogenum]|uniref:Uncharacterized protein n=1 Tax=Clostridium autoethanogenum DSM 10061 TaxID=1341692 RepID=A0ABN4BLR4_9CLOT|nr:hypothetical protein [Clostridium autoethanogenum]AGY77721.1 hypothetical protein CAETHG_3518 [Clostridium autoethanogenum DSM 10061]ALU37859.1 Hypothetical protein CLAU_3432 [Clostridium autoethanogenum DSM 10061]OVY49790.1 hypothetical protein WX72_03169 [Clostridium autoethanogenum]
MAKCILCNKKIKFARKCPALNETICSTCCGNKKGSEIQCTNSCNYFVEGQIKENKKQIIQLVKESFNSEFEDIYQDEKILRLVAPFEKFIFKNYYNHRDVTDEFISDCYTKMYYSLEGKGNVYSFNEIEKDIFDEFNKIVKKTKMPIEAQKLILIRMMKSVDSMTGGMFENRMYLELLRNNFTGTGIVAEVMGKM